MKNTTSILVVVLLATVFVLPACKDDNYKSWRTTQSDTLADSLSKGSGSSPSFRSPSAGERWDQIIHHVGKKVGFVFSMLNFALAFLISIAIPILLFILFREDSEATALGFAALLCLLSSCLPFIFSTPFFFLFIAACAPCAIPALILAFADIGKWKWVVFVLTVFVQTWIVWEIFF